MSAFGHEDDDGNKNPLGLPNHFSKMDAIRAFAKLKNETELKIKQENLSVEEMKEAQRKLAAGREQCLDILGMTNVVCCCNDKECTVDKASCETEQFSTCETCYGSESGAEETRKAEIPGSFPFATPLNGLETCAGNGYCEHNACLDSPLSPPSENIADYTKMGSGVAACHDAPLLRDDVSVVVESLDVNEVKNLGTKCEVGERTGHGDAAQKPQQAQFELVVKDEDEGRAKGLCGLGWLCF